MVLASFPPHPPHRVRFGNSRTGVVHGEYIDRVLENDKQLLLCLSGCRVLFVFKVTFDWK